MEENFKKFRQFLEKDESLREKNPILDLTKRWEAQELNFYEYMDEMQNFHRVLKFYSERLPSCGIKKIEISDEEVVFITRKEEIKLCFNGVDRTSVPIWMLNFGSYESEEVDIYNKLIEDKMTILDVGANIGYLSIMWSKKFPNSSIYAFEPIRETFGYLKKNLKINNCQNIIPVPFALSNENKNDFFYCSPEIMALASEKNVLGYKKVDKIPVSFISLDFFNIGDIDFIKLDTEGSEYRVLQGAIQTLKEFHPMLVVEFFEYWDTVFGYHPNEVINFLKEYGYRSFLPEKGKLREVFSHEKGDFSKQNYIFLHSDRHINSIKRLV